MPGSPEQEDFDYTTVSPSEGPCLEIDAKDLEDAQRDPKVKKLIADAIAYGERLEAEGRIITHPDDLKPDREL